MLFHRAWVNRTSLAMLALGLAGFAIGVFLGSCTSSGVNCSAGLSRCGLGCADFKSDVHNCGGCNLNCQTHQICQAGQCLCQPGTILCGGSCVLPSSDPQNCGGCAGTDGGVACTAAQVCEGGQCKSQCTLPGLTACARACVDVSLDPDNCGGCGTACGLDGGVDGGALLCNNGQCSAQCSGGRLGCNRSCINPLTDSSNCGGCGNVCNNARSCHNGNCLYDLVAACYNTGQVVGIQSGTDLVGPLSAIGTNPQALGVDQNFLLVADGTDRQLRQASLSDLAALPAATGLGASPNHILVDGTYVYVVNSLGNTLQILRADGGTPDAGLGLTTIGELNLDAGTSPQAIAKIGNDLYIPLQGGFTDVSAAGLVHVDVSNPASPTRRETLNFAGIDLRSFDGGRTDPRPSGIAVRGGQLYVSLSNLSPGFGPPGGPGVLAKVNRDTGAITPIYLPDGCLDAFWVASAGDFVFVSCGGKVQYDQPPPFPVEKSALVAVNNADQPIASWSASCAGAPSCTSPSAGRFTISGDRLYVGDNLSGRVFVLQLDGGQLIERRGYANSGQPLTPCPPNSMGLSYVPDIVSVP